MIPDLFKGRLSLPVIASPMFIVSGVDLVIAQCKAGVVGTFPALSARPQGQLDEWLSQIEEELAEHDRDHPDQPAAPFGVNLIVHRSNARLEQDLLTCERHKVKFVITSLGAQVDVNKAIHRWGGVVFHDVINQLFAHKAVEKGADGLILVAAGAGGHAGTTSPMALVAETRDWFSGPVALSGAISNGRAIRAAQVLGADFAYIGSAFIATQEAAALPGYKSMIVDSSADHITYTNFFTGVHANYLAPSIRNVGLDPGELTLSDKSKMNIDGENSSKPKAWKDVWGAGQGIGTIKDIVSVAELVDRLKSEYALASRATGLSSDFLLRKEFNDVV